MNPAQKKQNLPSLEPIGDDMARRVNQINSIWDYQQSSAGDKAANCCSLRFIKGVHHFCVSEQGSFIGEPNHTLFQCALAEGPRIEHTMRGYQVRALGSASPHRRR